MHKLITYAAFLMPRPSLTFPQDFLDKSASILNRAIPIDGSKFGCIQVYNPISKCLEMAVQQGFDSSFMDVFGQLSPAGTTICARGFRSAAPVIIPNIHDDPHFIPVIESEPDLGFQSLQSTPVFSSEKEVIGMLTTFFPEINQALSSSQKQYDLLAKELAVQIERVKGLLFP